MPTCNLQKLNAKRYKNLVGYLVATTTCFFGVIFESKIVQTNPLLLCKEICCSLATQVYMQGDANFGKILANEMRDKIETLKKPSLSFQREPIVIPREKKGDRRKLIEKMCKSILFE